MINEIMLVSLGSGSTIPANRLLASTYVRADGDEYLIDAPEGVQHQLLTRGVGLTVDTIFITNRAKRSVLGLPGLLNTLSFFSDREKPLTIHCPPGALERVRTIVEWFDDINYVVNVKELIPGRFEYTSDRYRIDTLDTNLYSAYGLKFTEKNPRGTFDREKAEALGVPVGPKFSKLCNGEAVEAADGSIVEPEAVLSAAPDPLNVVFSGRTGATDAVKKAAQNANVLVHDATTFDRLAVNTDRASISDAVAVANNAQPDLLLLNRISSRIANYSDEKLVKEAQKSQEGSYDIKVFSVGTELTITHKHINIGHRNSK